MTESLGLSHVGIRTADLDRAARFYTAALPGAIIRQRSEPDRRIWVKLLGITLEIAEVPAWESLTESQRRSLPQIALLVRPAEMDEITAGLDAANVPHHGPVRKMAGDSVGLYFADPDCNPFSLSCNEGYPGGNLPRNAQMWFPSQYTWQEPAKR